MPTVDEVCSVPADIIGLPDSLRIENWYHQGRHNALEHFDSEEIAWTVLRDDLHIRLEQDGYSDPPWRAEIVRPCAERFDLFAHKLLPVLFVNERQEELSLPELHVTPILDDYQRLAAGLPNDAVEPGATQRHYLILEFPEVASKPVLTVRTGIKTVMRM